ncbi:MAG: alpha/beta fold hydrolase [Dehalococcoidia bacterium]|nr:alpha/beta fold hydrolase [Dehalococcoidia bacterium]
MCASHAAGSPQTLHLLSDGLKLWAELYRPDGKAERLPALVVCHGIPGAPPDPRDRGYPALAERLCRDGFLTLLLNFRGAGQSEGNFDILGWTRDLGVALDHLSTLEGLDRRRLSVLGFSGGAAVAIYVAAHDQRITSVVSAASPARFKAISGARGMADLLEHSRRVKIIKDKDFPASFEEWSHGFDVVSPADWVGRISPRPLLILHGDQDAMVPVSQSRELYQRAGEPKDLRVLPGIGHRLRLEEKAMAIARDWLRKTNGLH